MKKNYICKRNKRIISSVFTSIIISSKMALSRIVYYDVLNIISCMAVVILHSNGYIHEFIKDDYWGIHVAIDTLFFFAVPVFFMLSGANLFNYRKKYSTKVFINKRLKKTFLPFLFWSLFFFITFIIIHWDNETKLLTWRKIIQIIVTGKIPLTNYWFFIPLFFLYIFMPFISLMIGAMNTRQISYLCMLLVLFQSIIPTLLSAIGIYEELPLPLNSYILYALLGYLFSIKDLEKNKTFMTILCTTAIISLAIRFWLNYNSDVKNESLFNYFGLYSLLPSCSIFLIVKSYFTQDSIISRNCKRIISFLAPKSFGVFLIHTFIIRLLANIHGFDMNNIWFIPVAFFVSYSSSVIIVHLLQKNNITKHIVP